MVDGRIGTVIRIVPNSRGAWAPDFPKPINTEKAP